MRQGLWTKWGGSGNQDSRKKPGASKWGSLIGKVNLKILFWLGTWYRILSISAWDLGGKIILPWREKEIEARSVLRVISGHSLPTVYPGFKSESLGSWEPCVCMCVCVCVCAQSLQLRPTLCDPKDCSPLGSSVHGILQTGISDWVAISFSRGSSQSRDETQVSCVSCTATWEAQEYPQA